MENLLIRKRNRKKKTKTKKLTQKRAKRTLMKSTKQKQLNEKIQQAKTRKSSALAKFTLFYTQYMFHFNAITCYVHLLSSPPPKIPPPQPKITKKVATYCNMP